MPKLLHYFILPFLIIFLALTFVPSSYAQESSQGQSTQDVSKAIKKSEDQFIGVMHVVSCLATGKGLSENTCFGNFQSGVSFTGGLLSMAGSFLADLYNTPPLSTKQYLASVGSNLGLVKEAHAQVSGSGNSVISLIFIFWQATRNLSYVLLTVVFIVIGVMVLIGSKSGQSVVTVQSALPGLVISLVMITFSYFLAALITDIAFFGCYIVGYYFTNIVNITVVRTGTILEFQNLLTIFFNFIFNWDNFLSVYTFINFMSDSNLLIKGVVMGVGAFVGAQLFAPIGTLVGSLWPGGGQAGGIIANIIGAGDVILTPGAPEVLTAAFVYIILAIALIIAMVKLIVDLLKRYITILFLTILAPVQFLFAAFPGNGKTYESWIRNMLCQVLPFPAVFGAFYFASYFLVGDNLFGVSNPSITTINGSFLKVPYLSALPNTPLSGLQYTARVVQTNSTMPLFGGLNLGIVAQVIGFGVLLATPAIPEFVCKLVGGKLDDVFGKEIQGSWTAGQSKFSGYRQRVGNAAGRLEDTGKEIGKRFKIPGTTTPTAAAPPAGPGPGVPIRLP